MSHSGTKWTAKQGDVYGYIVEQLLDENLEPVDLTAITSLRFEMERRGDTDPTVADDDHTEVIGDPTDGIVRYTWQPGDLDEPGEFRFEWRVEFSTDRVQTFPSNGYNTVEVLRQLNA